MKQKENEEHQKNMRINENHGQRGKTWGKLNKNEENKKIKKNELTWKNKKYEEIFKKHIKWRKIEETLRNLWKFPRFCLNTQNPRRFPQFAVFVVTFFRRSPRRFPRFFFGMCLFPEENQKNNFGRSPFFRGKVTTFIGFGAGTHFTNEVYQIVLALGCSSAKRRASFKLSFTRRETLLTIFLSKCRTNIFFKSVVVSRFTFLNSILNVQRQQWLQLLWLLIFTIKKTSPEFLRLAASSLRFWFHAIVYWTTVCCHSSIRPSKSHGGPRETWPWNTRRSSMRLAFPWARVFLFVPLLLECRPFFWSHHFMIVLKLSMGPLAHEDLNPEIYSPDPELSWNQARLRAQVFQYLHPWEVVSLFTGFGSSTGTLELCVAVLVSPGCAVL